MDKGQNKDDGRLRRDHALANVCLFRVTKASIALVTSNETSSSKNALASVLFGQQSHDDGFGQPALTDLA